MKLKNEEYYANWHSCFLLQYHLVLVTKFRYPEALNHYYWKPYFWSLSYFIGSVSERSVQAVKSTFKTKKTRGRQSTTSNP